MPGSSGRARLFIHLSSFFCLPRVSEGGRKKADLITTSKRRTNVEQNKIENQTQENKNSPVTFVDARVALSRDGKYILHFLDDGRILRKAANLYRHVLKVPYQRKNGEQVAFA